MSVAKEPSGPLLELCVHTPLSLMKNLQRHLLIMDLLFPACLALGGELGTQKSMLTRGRGEIHENDCNADTRSAVIEGSLVLVGLGELGLPGDTQLWSGRVAVAEWGRAFQV